MPLDTRLTVTLSARATIALDLVAPSAPLNMVTNLILTNGVGANQADLMFSDAGTLAPDASVELDLAGALTDPFGASLAFARLKLIMVTAPPSNPHPIVFGGSANNPFNGPFVDPSDKITIAPGGIFVSGAPGALGSEVVPGSGDQLRVANGGSASPVGYSIVLIGASA